MHRFVPLARAAAGAFALAGVTAAQAHVSLEVPVGFAGASYKAAFQVGPGCGRSPTRQVLPAAIGGHAH